MDNAADQSQIDRKRNRQQEVQTARKQVICSLMTQRLGRLYLWDELSHLNVFVQTLQFGKDGYASTAFAEGRRSIGLRLLADIMRWCPDDYLQMTRENTDILERTQDERSADSPDDE